MLYIGRCILFFYIFIYREAIRAEIISLDNIWNFYINLFSHLQDTKPGLELSTVYYN